MDQLSLSLEPQNLSILNIVAPVIIIKLLNTRQKLKAQNNSQFLCVKLTLSKTALGRNICHHLCSVQVVTQPSEINKPAHNWSILTGYSNQKRSASSLLNRNAQVSTVVCVFYLCGLKVYKSWSKNINMFTWQPRPLTFTFSCISCRNSFAAVREHASGNVNQLLIH